MSVMRAILVRHRWMNVAAGVRHTCTMAVTHSAHAPRFHRSIANPSRNPVTGSPRFGVTLVAYRVVPWLPPRLGGATGGSGRAGGEV